MNRKDEACNQSTARRRVEAALCLMMLSATLATPAAKGETKSSANDAYYKPGPLKHRTIEFPALEDAKRKRRVPIKAVFPETGGPFPLVIMCHGGAGNWDAHLYDAQHLATHGYVSLCLEHVYSNTKTVKEYMGRAFRRAALMKALQRITTDPRAVLERPKDVTFAIDQAILWNRNHRHLKGKVDTGKIAVMGHSFGAYTTLVVCGAQPILDHLLPKTGAGKGLAGDLSDPRVNFGFCMSPQSPGTTFFGPQSYASIKRPLFCLSGSKDEQKASDASVMPAAARLEGFRLMPKGKKRMLWLKNADHMSFADNPKAWRFPNKAREDTRRIAMATLLLCCDARLKGDAKAKAKLTPEYVRSLRGEVVTEVTWLEKNSDVDALLARTKAAGRTIAGSFAHGDATRTYRLYVPASHGKKPMPLLIALHGGGGNGQSQIRLTKEGFNRLAEKDSFLVAYPDGMLRRWNDGRKQDNKTDDVGFLAALISEISRSYPVDRQRVYMTGISNGSMMSQRFALERAHLIAGIGAVGGTLPVNNKGMRPSVPVPAIIIHGREDELCPWTGGQAGIGNWKVGTVLSAPETVKFWLKHNRSNTRATRKELPDLDPQDGTTATLEVYEAGKGGAPVAFCDIKGGGHTWPCGYQYAGEAVIGKTSKDVDACKLIWDFLKAHHRRPATESARRPDGEQKTAK